MANRTSEAADTIREMVGQPPEDVEQLEESMAHLHEVLEGVRDAYNQWADAVEETKIDKQYADMVHEVASGVDGQAQQIEEALRGGVMQR